ncbi:MAG: Transcriptional regulator, TetR family [Frankiales bacterium]|nr:Transcriptional regulator, TetR family [Frankiales bacterium]
MTAGPGGRPATESSIRLSYAEKVRELLRDSLQDAAGEALARDSWTATRIADLAAAVGVSRQTVYNEFGSKDELGRALLLRESIRFLNEVEAALDEHPGDAVAGLTAALEVFLRLSAEQPLLRAIIVSGGDDSRHTSLGALLTGQGATVLPFVTDRLTGHFLTEWPEADRDQVLSYADAVVRLAISHVILPAARPEVTATELGQVFAPYLSRITTQIPRNA